MTINARIATAILRAQNASDGGKGISDLVGSSRSIRDNQAGYSRKASMIRDALRLISRGGTAFHFAVVRDIQKRATYIVYFWCKVEGTTYQVSFHSFDPQIERYVRNSYRVKWDRGCSRESARCIYRAFCPLGTYCVDESECPF